MSVNAKSTESKKGVGRWTPEEHQRFMAGNSNIMQLSQLMVKTGKKWRNL